MSTIYVHWPFCISKCNYCDFNSIVCKEQIHFNDWLDNYKRILLKFKNEFYKGEGITSVYFGGGTPSLLPVSFVGKILEEISNNFSLKSDAEITLEANPKTICVEKAKGLKSAGINRMSIGVQSLIDADLKILGRIHSSKDAIDCVLDASNVFDNLSIDLIYNRPKQKLSDWESELKEALSLPITHVSLYELIVEDKTALKKMIDEGRIEAPNGGGEFMETTIKVAESLGFNQYEVSNFCKEGFDGKHNLSYWKYEDYYGVGPGSHSRVSINDQKIAIAQINKNEEWVNWAKNPEFNKELLSEDDVFKERLIMGLRSKCGFDATKISDTIKNRYKFNDKVEKLLKNSYIIASKGKIASTRRGLLRLNLVVEYFISE